MRPLFRILLAVAVAVLLAAPGQASAATCGGADSSPDALTLEQYNAAVLCLLDGERDAAGLGPLDENSRLEHAAVKHSRSMRAHDYFAHSRFLARIKRSGYTKPAGQWLVGENLGVGNRTTGTPRVMVASWMQSAEHRANVLNPRFADIGIGTVRGGPAVSTARPARVTITTDFGWRTAG